ncbi:MAG: A/G-specific adenine glycosylase [Sphingopyxis sp.]
MPVECPPQPATPTQAALAADGARWPIVQSAILAWYRAHARVLPWRAPPGANARTDAYHVWLSEIMLQQTTVAAVAPYFVRFTTRWPTLADLAAADPADVLAAWAGLGYYSRARNLLACAGVVMRDHGGQLPADHGQLRALPGVGDYTAAAIAAIAFGLDAVPVDANIERVVARLCAIDAPLPGARRAIRAAAAALWPHDGSGGDFAQALMDMGARLCTARAPNCGECPVAQHCRAHALGVAAALPVKPARRPRPHRVGRASAIVQRGTDGVARIWLVRRPPRGLLGGMRALPGGDWVAVADDGPAPAPLSISPSASPFAPPPVADLPPGTRTLGPVRHVFTHFSLDLWVDILPDATRAVGEGEWWPIVTLDGAGLPTLYRHASTLIEQAIEPGER